MDDEIGFPEGQLVPWGMSLKTAQKVAKAFNAGKDMRSVVPNRELTPMIEGIINQLEQHSRYGQSPGGKPRGE